MPHTANEQARVLEELRARERRKDEFLTMLAHELRSPLAPIASAVEVLAIKPENEETAAKAHEIIRRQLYRLTRLIEDLADLSRIVRGRVELRKLPLDLAAVLIEAIETVAPLVDLHSHRLSVQRPPQPVLVNADAARLVQVFVNLLDNAIKYTEPGGSICIELQREDAFARVNVRDSGIGIDPEWAPLIFDLFTRAETAPHPNRDGLGIGLAVARQIVELHGGSIAVHSEGHGRGSEFAVSLPLLPADTLIRN